ncbi:hypothetical protein AC579_9066 [Pseudocercospora musae]|uniref:Uncharacterized protein n=1 Tax=Pseudocercospora musae TaxID=113226 RepID=A0A139IF48_9PEZI|nr:hypothetical protein AC579_9066 [Pseudocercospora musae]
MLGQTLRASSQSLARAALRQNAVTLRRTFITPTAELKAYKPAPLKANDSEGQVQKFTVPKPPPSPEEADLQNDLQAYEQQTPEVAGQASAGESAPVQDWFVEEAEEEEAHGHH